MKHKKLPLKYRRDLDKCPSDVVRNIFEHIYDHIDQAPSIVILGVTFYSQFNLISITADGFPAVRFIFSGDYQQVCFVFASEWRNNHKLMHMANPNSIPYMFPIADLITHLRKVVV